MALSNKFQKRLYALIDDFECTRQELCALSSVNSVTISHALVYGIIPSTKSLIKLADYFEVSIPYLLGETDENDFVKSENPTTFAERFNALCTEKGFNNNSISKEIGIVHTAVLRWLSKGYLPELDILERLCEKLEVSPDYLLGRTDYRN